MVPYTKKIPALQVISAKILDKEHLAPFVAKWHFKGKKVVFTNGCFDIIHRGHIDYLAKAADLGDKLIVGLNSDASVKQQGKSSSRPLQDEQTRAMILASLHFVDAVVLFNEDTPYELIDFIEPEVLVKGADYDAGITDKKDKKYIVGSDIVKAKGGEVKTIPFLDGFSTTAIEQKIKAS
jgi:rfaE bifunctional protein nucleotidyltransferase chain/domain